MGRLLTRRNLLLIDIWLFSVLATAILALIVLGGAEARLNSKGSAFELNPDASGRLWISDFNAKQVWVVDPTTSSYKIYPVSGSPVDARWSNGWLWWVDGQSNRVGRISTNDGNFTEWQIPDAAGFLGTNLDAEGRLFTTDSSNPYLYRLDSERSNLCTYNLPGFGASNYIVRDGDYLWLGDWYDSTLLRLDLANDQLTWWTLPVSSSPFGMALDEQGNIWYADQGTKMIIRFVPSINQLTGYLLPKGDYPQMVAVQSGLVWYSEQSLPSIGRLDPLTAKGETITLDSQEEQLTPSCVEISPSGQGTTTITSGKLSWPNKKFTPIMNSDGWLIYQLPENSDPWGISLSEYGYVVDSGRQVLVRFNPNVELPPVTLVRQETPSQTAVSIAQAITPTLTLMPTSTATLMPTPTEAAIQQLQQFILPIVMRESASMNIEGTQSAPPGATPTIGPYP